MEAEIDDLFVVASQQLDACIEENKITDDLFVVASQQLDACIEENKITDDLFVVASQQLDETTRTDNLKPENMTCSRFGKPVSLDELDDVKDAGIPKNTNRTTAWASKVWSDWVSERRNIPFIEAAEKSYPFTEQFHELTGAAMCFWLTKFVIEARNKKGESYPPSSLYSLCCGLQRTIRASGINIFVDSAFANFVKYWTLK